MRIRKSPKKFATNRWAAVGIATAACMSLAACGTASDFGDDAAGAAGKAAAASKSFPAKVDINGRKHIGDSANAAGSKENAYEKGDEVPVRCQATNDDGSLWIYTKDKYWVPDKFVKTGTDGYAPGVRHCKNDNSGGNGDGDKHKVHGRPSNGNPGSKKGSSKEKIERVIKVAEAQAHRGYQYSWGAGGKGGAAYGVHHYGSGAERSKGDDYNRYGYDCSGLTLHAFWKGAGVDIGDATPQQYQKGKKVSTKHLKRGDMVFWGNGDNAGSTTHVAIYLGKGKIVQAAPPRTKNSVQVTDLYGRGDWTSHAVRIFG